MSDSNAALERLARTGLRVWRDSPPRFVREVFGITPDAWQDEALAAFPSSPRLAFKACKGPGKTAVLAWIAWNFLLTRPHPRIGVMSITGDNLRANLWTELAYWRDRSPMLQATFEQTRSEIFARDHPQTWKLEARTWAKDATREQIGHALAGLHSRYVMWLMDESGAYPDAIMPIAEGIFSGEPIEAHIVQAGNPLVLSGPLYRACTTARKLWTIIEITGDPDDPNRSPRIPIEYARQQIEQYGADNPWVLSSIFGRFPPASPNALIGPDELSEAMRRSYHESDIATAARVLGVDVARFGDDASVIFPRQGLVMYEPMVYRNIDSAQGAGVLVRKWNDWNADAAFVDDSGGYGAGWIDQCRILGRAPIGVQFAGKPYNSRYYNKRAEMYFELVSWIKRGGQLPRCPELVTALTETTYSFKGDAFLLESKDQLKDRIGFSPDHGDAAALTFAQPVERHAAHPLPGRSMHRADYDPMRAFREQRI